MPNATADDVSDDDTLVSLSTCQLASKLSPWTSQMLCKIQQAATNWIIFCNPVSLILSRHLYLPLRRPKAFSVTNLALLSWRLNFVSVSRSHNLNKASSAWAIVGILGLQGSAVEHDTHICSVSCRERESKSSFCFLAILSFYLQEFPSTPWHQHSDCILQGVKLPCF